MKILKFNPIEQLKNDKDTLLEGYITEFLFKNQFLDNADKPVPYSHGWWSGFLKGKRIVFVLRNNLSPLDKEIITLLKSKYECWQVTYDNGNWFFLDEDLRLTKSDFLVIYSLRKQSNSSGTADETKSEDRQNKCIDFFQNHQLLSEIAIERKFVDDFLSVYFSFVMNIDFFTKNSEGNICAIEVKFKSESQGGYFGIGPGQLIWLKELSSQGIDIFYALLYKDAMHKDMTILEYLDDKNIEKAWYIHQIDTSDISGHAIGPKKTSINGKKQQPFEKIRKSAVLSNQKILLNFK